MGNPGWLAQQTADLPAGDGWLGTNERRVMTRMTVDRRRDAWRLGRWTAKAALTAWLALPPGRLEVLAASDGAPEAWSGGRRLPVSVSLSHRAGRGIATVVNAPQVTGCDLEQIEPRSGAFVREWLAPTEQRLVNSIDQAGRAMLVNAIWTAKEAAAKVRREGLRLDLRGAVVTLDGIDAPGGAWRGLRVDWEDAVEATTGWWRSEPGWVMAIAGRLPSDPPQQLGTA